MNHANHTSDNNHNANSGVRLPEGVLVGGAFMHIVYTYMNV